MALKNKILVAIVFLSLPASLWAEEKACESPATGISLVSVAEGGKLITLDDGSRWRVKGDDDIGKVMSWSTASAGTITICNGDTMTNSQNGTTIHPKKLP